MSSVISHRRGSRCVEEMDSPGAALFDGMSLAYAWDAKVTTPCLQTANSFIRL